MASSSSASSKEGLANFHRAIVQILLAHRCLTEDDLIKFVDYVKSDYIPNQTYLLRDTFTAINKDLRELGLEIKSVAVKRDEEDGGGFQYYHGVVNNEEDLVARDYGNYFDATELKYFANIITRLLTAKSFSSSDIIAFKPTSAWLNSRVHDFLAKLSTDKWLARDDRNHYIIGPRAYLELRGYLETAITNKQAEEDGEDDGNTDQQLQALLQALPSIIFY